MKPLPLLRVSQLVGFIVMSSLWLAGCAQLQGETRDLTQPGPYEVRVNGELILYDVEQDRDVKMRVTWPSGPGPYPLVAFSHGAFCYPQQYANVTDFWVSHGYIVVLPDHLDSPNGPKMSGRDLPNLLTSRVRDMSFILDSRYALEEQIPELKGKIDFDRSAVAGHSFGGMIAMIKSGLKMEAQVDGAPMQLADKRFQAAVVMSGVGQMKPMTALPQVPTMSADAFQGLQGPLIATGGTLDEGNVGTGEIFPWQWRMAAYTESPPGDKYYLALDKSDHYLGGLICRDNMGGEDDPVAVATVRAVQTAFLDAYIKGDDRAFDWLAQADIATLSEGRATFESK